MKHWKVDYSVRHNSAFFHGVPAARRIEELDMIVEADNIIEAVEVAARKYAEQPPTSENSDMVIWNVGIMEDEVF